MRLDYAGSTDLVSPSTFIQAAERGGYMPAVDKTVVSRTFKLLANRLEEEHYSINLSGETMSDRHFTDWLTEQVLHWAVKPSQVTFELTETTAIVDIQQIKIFADYWRSLGGGFALDDFGAGCTNLTHLKQLPVTSLKIDGAVIQGVCDNAADLLSVDFFVNLARLRNITTVAEWVETQKLQVFLQGLGVDFQQGYVVGRPEAFPSSAP